MPSHKLLAGVSTAALDPAVHAGSHRTTIAEPEHLTLNEAADWLRCSTRTLQRLLETGSGPPVIRLSERRLIFALKDLRHWLAERTTGRSEPESPRRRPKRRAGSL